MNSLLKQKIAECYGAQGYTVIHQPTIQQIPFDLKGHRPDLLVQLSENQGFIVDVKQVATNLSIDLYCEIAKTVSEQSGWRFLLITEEDATPIAEEDVADYKISRSQVLSRKERVAKLISIGDHEAAFLSLWIFAEVLMRRHARSTLIPIDRLPTILMIQHLHNQDKISPNQFERAIALNEIRNRVAHGFPVQSVNLNDALDRLLNLVDEFIAMQQ